MFSFPHVDPNLDILFEMLTEPGWFEFEKYHLHTVSQGLIILCKSCVFLNIFSGGFY